MRREAEYRAALSGGDLQHLAHGLSGADDEPREMNYNNIHRAHENQCE